MHLLKATALLFPLCCGDVLTHLTHLMHTSLRPPPEGVNAVRHTAVRRTPGDSPPCWTRQRHTKDPWWESESFVAMGSHVAFFCAGNDDGKGLSNRHMGNATLVSESTPWTPAHRPWQIVTCRWTMTQRSRRAELETGIPHRRISSRCRALSGKGRMAEP